MDRLITSFMNTYKNTLNISADQEAVLQYAIRLVIGTCLSYFWAILIAILTGNLLQVLIIMSTVSILRTFSGGAHCSSMKNCIIYGTIMMNILAIITKVILLSKTSILFLVFGTLMFSLWAINRYAPADTPGKPIVTKQKRDKLKERSYCVVFLWVFLVVMIVAFSPRYYSVIYTSAVGILWQASSLTRIGYKFCSIADQMLNIFQRKEGIYK